MRYSAGSGFRLGYGRFAAGLAPFLFSHFIAKANYLSEYGIVRERAADGLPTLRLLLGK